MWSNIPFTILGKAEDDPEIANTSIESSSSAVMVESSEAPAAVTEHVVTEDLAEAATIDISEKQTR